MEVDARIEVECQQTIISYLKGFSYLKLYCKKQSNQKPTANIVSTTRRTTLCGVRSNNIDLARAKSEALDNIYSFFKQNINSCNAKQRRQRRRTVKKQQ